AFSVERSIFRTAIIGLAGDLGYPGGGTPDGVVRASYRRQKEDGWSPTIALTVRRFSTPDAVPHGGALQALALSYSDGFSVGICSISSSAATPKLSSSLGARRMRFAQQGRSICTSRRISSLNTVTPLRSPTPALARASIQLPPT